MQETQAVKALIDDVMHMAKTEGKFKVPSPAEQWNSLYRNFDYYITGSAHEEQTQKIKQKKDNFRAKIKGVLEKIDNGNEITNLEDIDICEMICRSSPK